MAHPILLYDGVCGLCNRLVQFVLRRDHGKIFRFASLQSGFSARILARHNLSAGELDTVYVVVDSSEQLLSRSDAVLFVLRQLGGVWGLAAVLLGLLARVLRDFAYNSVARHRSRIFGRSETCILPTPGYRERFIDV